MIKVGHHGSRTSTGDSMLDVLRPSIAVISVGGRNRYGHPHPLVLRRLDDRGIAVLRTDERGSVRIRVDRAGRTTVTAER
jgi:competence protein ComEC